VASRYWEYGEAGDATATFEVEHRIPLLAGDYFQGRDPALEAILEDRLK
jgi:hypothetical protein